MNKISLIFLLLLAVWSCSEDDEAVTDNTANDENTQRTFAEAQVRYEALRENFKHSLTREAGLPTSGTMVYKGMHMGEFFERKGRNSQYKRYTSDELSAYLDEPGASDLWEHYITG